MAGTKVIIYLFIYNLLQTIGWSYLLVQILQYYQTGPKGVSLYDYIKCPLIIFQNAALLEVVHAALRFVRSSPVLTFGQISSRIVVVCGVLIPTLEARESVGLLLLLFAWTVTEIIRYSTYALNLINKVPYFLLWLRYSTFIVLYPIGVTGELLCIYAAVQEVSRTKLWTIEFPNKWNAMFRYDHFLIFVMLLYIPFFPQLYLHMVSQRKKVLGGSKVEKKKVK